MWQEAERGPDWPGFAQVGPLALKSPSVQLGGSCLPSSLDFGHVAQLEVLPAFCSQAAH